MKTTLLGLLFLPGLLTAQSVPLGGDDPRVLQLHQVAEVTEPQELSRLEDFAKRFVEPTLDEGEDIRAMGSEHLVVLGRPAQQAWTSRLLEQHKASRDYALDVEIELLDVPIPAFNAHFRALFAPRSETWKKLQAVRPPGDDTAAWLDEVLGDKRITRVEVPRLLAQPCEPAVAVQGETLRVVRDYEVEFARKRAVAKAQMADLLDGTRLQATCALIDRDVIGVDFDLVLQAVARPITEFETSLAGRDDKLVIDLPQWKSVHLQDHVTIQTGGVAVVSAPNNDRYAIAIVRARVVR